MRKLIQCIVDFAEWRVLLRRNAAAIMFTYAFDFVACFRSRRDILALRGKNSCVEDLTLVRNRPHQSARFAAEHEQLGITGLSCPHPYNRLLVPVPSFVLTL